MANPGRISSGGPVGGARVGGGPKISVGGPEGGARFSLGPSLNKAPSLTKGVAKYGSHMSSRPINGPSLDVGSRIQSPKIDIGSTKRTEKGWIKSSPISRPLTGLANPSAEVSTPKGDVQPKPIAAVRPSWLDRPKPVSVPRIEPLRQPAVEPLRQAPVERAFLPTRVEGRRGPSPEVRVQPVAKQVERVRQEVAQLPVKVTIDKPTVEKPIAKTAIKQEVKEAKQDLHNTAPWMRAQLVRERQRAELTKPSVPEVKNKPKVVPSPIQTEQPANIIPMPVQTEQVAIAKPHTNEDSRIAAAQVLLLEDEKKKKKRKRIRLGESWRIITTKLVEKVNSKTLKHKLSIGQAQKQENALALANEQVKQQVKPDTLTNVNSMVEVSQLTKGAEIILFQAARQNREKPALVKTPIKDTNQNNDEEKVRVYRSAMKSRLKKWGDAIARVFPAFDLTTTRRLRDIAANVQQDSSDDSHQSLLQGRIDGSRQGKWSWISRFLGNKTQVVQSEAYFAGQIAIDETPAGTREKEGARILKYREEYVITQTGDEEKEKVAA